MPGQAPPLGGIQGFWALLQSLTARLVSLETWQRQQRTLGPGTITRWGGSSPPPGALLCNGASFSPSAYPALYQALGNSSTLPNVPGSPITIIWT